MAFSIRPVTAADRDWIVSLLIEHWGSTRLVSRGLVHDGAALPGFLALQENRRRGLVTYRFHDDQCEIATLNSLAEGMGIGSALVAAVRDAARDEGCRRLWLITTNDNSAAQTFYRQRGFRLARIHRDAIAVSRRLKPEIPLVAANGVPITDEIEFELLL